MDNLYHCIKGTGREFLFEKEGSHVSGMIAYHTVSPGSLFTRVANTGAEWESSKLDKESFLMRQFAVVDCKNVILTVELKHYVEEYEKLKSI